MHCIYLGMCIDLLKMEICLPEVKLQELLSELDFWVNRNKCTKKELQSRIGKLSSPQKLFHTVAFLYQTPTSPYFP